MTQAKRQLSVEMLSIEDDRKKFRSFDENQFITYLEDLSNELVYEIFDYLDGRDIFNGFSNLNIRFKHLITSPLLHLKIHHSSTSNRSFDYDYRQIIVPNKHRIISLHIPDRMQLIKLFTIHPIDSSFHRLECLTLHEIKFDELILLLSNLTNLIRLFSLNISLIDTLHNSNEIYRLVSRVSTLKYVKLKARTIILQDSLSIPMNEQNSSIKKLVISHPCTMYELCNILCYIPNLHSLTCDNFFGSSQFIPADIPLKIFNLTHCSINMCYLKFDEFELFIKKTSYHLRYLHFIPISDSNYLDADRWERLITQHIPYLQTFQFKYHDVVFGRAKSQPYHSFINRFTSLFWIEKRWFSDIQIDLERLPPIEIIFSIQPNRYIEENSFRNQWCDRLKSNSLFECMDVSNFLSQLTVRSCYTTYYDESLIDYIQFISSLSKITCLYVEFDRFSTDILVQFLHLLPDLNSLIIDVKLANQMIELTPEQINTIYATSAMNKIVKINILPVIEVNHIDILINLCPQIEYLQIKCRNTNELEVIIRLILMKRKSYLNSLCCLIPNANDLIIKRLQTMIYFEKLLVNYTIQCIYDRIYLQWQR